MIVVRLVVLVMLMVLVMLAALAARALALTNAIEERHVDRGDLRRHVRSRAAARCFIGTRSKRVRIRTDILCGSMRNMVSGSLTVCRACCTVMRGAVERNWRGLGLLSLLGSLRTLHRTVHRDRTWWWNVRSSFFIRETPLPIEFSAVLILGHMRLGHAIKGVIDHLIVELFRGTHRLPGETSLLG
jgi:hypothetical protein